QVEPSATQRLRPGDDPLRGIGGEEGGYVGVLRSLEEARRKGDAERSEEHLAGCPRISRSRSLPDRSQDRSIVQLGEDTPPKISGGPGSADAVESLGQLLPASVRQLTQPHGQH